MTPWLSDTLLFLVQTGRKTYAIASILRHIPISEMLKYNGAGLWNVCLRADGIQWKLIKSRKSPWLLTWSSAPLLPRPATHTLHLRSVVMYERHLCLGAEFVLCSFNSDSCYLCALCYTWSYGTELRPGRVVSWKPSQLQYKSLTFLKNRKIRKFFWITLDLIRFMLPFEGLIKSLLRDSWGFLHALSDLAHL